MAVTGALAQPCAHDEIAEVTRLVVKETMYPPERSDWVGVINWGNGNLPRTPSLSLWGAVNREASLQNRDTERTPTRP